LSVYGASFLVLRSGLQLSQVAATEGRIRHTIARDHGVSGYLYEINSLRFPVSRAASEALDEALSYRVYYLSRGRRVLNIEPMGEGNWEPEDQPALASTPQSTLRRRATGGVLRPPGPPPLLARRRGGASGQQA